MQLYYHPFSPNARRALLVVEHLQLDVERKLLDLPEGAHRRPDYVALNPNAMIPTLVDGSFVLNESRAIMQYLAIQKPEAGLFPNDDRTRIDIARWQFWDACQYGPQTGALFMEKVLKPMASGEAPDPSVYEPAEERFERFSRVLDQHLMTREYLVGKGLTIADFSVAAALTYSGKIGLRLEPYRGIHRWLARLMQLDAWRNTIPELARG